MKKIKAMIMFANGNIAAFDDNTQQVGELQVKTAAQLWAEMATAMGYDVSECVCSLPRGPDLAFDGEWKTIPAFLKNDPNVKPSAS